MCGVIKVQSVMWFEGRRFFLMTNMFVALQRHGAQGVASVGGIQLPAESFPSWQGCG